MSGAPPAAMRPAASRPSNCDLSKRMRIRSESNDYNRVQAAIMLLRTVGQKPSAAKVELLLRTVDAGMRKSTICAHMRTFFGKDRNRMSDDAPEPELSAAGTVSENAAAGNRLGTGAEPSVAFAEPLLSTVGTA
jgi:hypothetical protein